MVLAEQGLVRRFAEFEDASVVLNVNSGRSLRAAAAGVALRAEGPHDSPLTPQLAIRSPWAEASAAAAFYRAAGNSTYVASGSIPCSSGKARTW
jgi:hypothetical protein